MEEEIKLGAVKYHDPLTGVEHIVNPGEYWYSMALIFAEHFYIDGEWIEASALFTDKGCGSFEEDGGSLPRSGKLGPRMRLKRRINDG